MVKGVTRRVIVVRQPDPRLFEQAIFIVKEDALGRDGVSADMVLAEARRVAGGYVRRRSPRRFLPWLWAGLVGAAAASGGWALALFLLMG